MPSSDNLTQERTPAKAATEDRALERRVVFAASLGTVFEWYDFFLYGSLAGVIAKQFFSGLNDTTAYLLSLIAFGSGLVVRPLGAVVFGRLGDTSGRKHTFLVTIVVMGAATFFVGLLPTYRTIGLWAPVMLVGLRLLQGLAIGGEYGGAAIYVAEHVPAHRRGQATAWIQTTATLGLILSLIVISVTRSALRGEFDVWGWRIPFLVSAGLLGLSAYVRMNLNESPVFQRMKAEGKRSKSPIKEVFGTWNILRVMLAALFGPIAALSVVWYTAQFYTLFLLVRVIKIDELLADYLMIGGLALATPCFIIAGALSDRIGRKPVVMAGCLLATVLYYPLFSKLVYFGNPSLVRAAAMAPIIVFADPSDCSLQFDPIGKKVFAGSCDVVKSTLAKAGVPYETRVSSPGRAAEVHIGKAVVRSFDGRASTKADFPVRQARFTRDLTDALAAAGYSSHAEAASINKPAVCLVIAAIVMLATLIYGPLAAWLVESFPTRVRYTAVSIPYHVGSGWIGGFVPAIAFALVAWSGDIYKGLLYPVWVSAIAFVIGVLFMPETKGRSLDASA